MADPTVAPRPSRRRFLMTAPAAAVAVGKAILPADAELLHLGAELERAWTHEKAADALWEPAYRAACGIFTQIEQSPATTLDGLRVKALAAHWCVNGDEFTPDIFQVVPHGSGPTTDIRLAASVLRDLLAIGRA